MLSDSSDTWWENLSTVRWLVPKATSQQSRSAWPTQLFLTRHAKNVGTRNTWGIIPPLTSFLVRLAHKKSCYSDCNLRWLWGSFSLLVVWQRTLSYNHKPDDLAAHLKLRNSRQNPFRKIDGGNKKTAKCHFIFFLLGQFPGMLYRHCLDWPDQFGMRTGQTRFGLKNKASNDTPWLMNTAEDRDCDWINVV